VSRPMLTVLGVEQIRTWEGSEPAPSVLALARSEGAAAGLACAPGSEPSGTAADFRLIQAFRVGYAEGKAARYASLRALRGGAS